MADQDDKVAQFASITGDAEHARFFLESANWDLNMATSSFFGAQEEGGTTAAPPEPSDPTPSASGPLQASGPFQGSGPIQGSSANPQSQPNSSNRAKPPQQKKKFGSIRDLQASTQSSSDDEDKDQEYFAGGDKSGLAVQDPSNPGSGAGSGGGSNDPIQRLLQTARQNRARPPGPNVEEDDDEATPGASRRNNFSGTGMTLGGDGAESTAIPDPSAPPTTTPNLNAPAGGGRPQMVERTLHLWDDGFSVDDGPLYRYDDPANSRTLEMINRGSAPLDLMNVESGQAVDVKLEQHRGEKYTRPKKKWRPFEGSGNRLGAPVPGEGSSSSTASAAPTAVPTASAPTDTSAQPADWNPNLPTVRLQIRLVDGTRLRAQFNTTATVDDVRHFVERAATWIAGRAYVLATTFPTKDLSDPAAVIGEIEELKKGGNVVQRWV